MRLNALLPLTLALLAAPSLQAEELPKAIQQLQAKGAVIKGSFDAPNGLRGYAAEYHNNGIALYLTPDGKHVLVGSLFDERHKRRVWWLHAAASLSLAVACVLPGLARVAGALLLLAWLGAAHALWRCWRSASTWQA